VEKKGVGFQESEVIVMNPIVEFCMSNLANGSQETFETLEKDPNLDVLEYGCLSYCTKCMETLYAVVNGEVVEADTPEELTERIYQFIEDNPLF
jgi:uncharacterized protein YuzB (UPF0349 family)